MTIQDYKRATVIIAKIKALKVDREKLTQNIKVVSEAVNLNDYVDLVALKKKIKDKIQSKIDDLKAEFQAL